MEKNYRFMMAIVDTNRGYMESVCQFAEMTYGIDSCVSYFGARQLLTAIRAGAEYQVAVLDTFLPDMNPMEFLREFAMINCPAKPVLLFTMVTPDWKYAQLLQSAGANQVVPKPNKISILLDAVSALAMDSEQYVRTRLREQIWWVLNEVGIPSCDGGFDYLFKAIEYTFNAGNNRIATKEIYPLIADQFGVSSHAVDSGLRRISEKYLPKDAECYRQLAKEAGLRPDENLSNTKLTGVLTERVVLRMGYMGRQYVEMKGNRYAAEK